MIKYNQIVKRIDPKAMGSVLKSLAGWLVQRDLPMDQIELFEMDLEEVWFLKMILESMFDSSLRKRDFLKIGQEQEH